MPQANITTYLLLPMGVALLMYLPNNNSKMTESVNNEITMPVVTENLQEDKELAIEVSDSLLFERSNGNSASIERQELPSYFIGDKDMIWQPAALRKDLSEAKTKTVASKIHI